MLESSCAPMQSSTTEYIFLHTRRYPVKRGYERFYGPFLHHSTVGDAADPESFFAAAAAVAKDNIAVANVVLPVVDHPWCVVSRLYLCV